MTLLIGSTSGLFSGISYLTRELNPSISSLLEKENKFSLLSNTDAEAWKESWEAYKQNNWGNSRDEWNIRDWKNSSEIPEEFKNICKQKASSKISSTSDPIYISVTSYCTKPKTIKEIFAKEGIKLLDTDGNKDVWISRFEEYFEYIDYLPTTNYDLEESDYNRLIEGCKALSNVQTTNIDYNDMVLLTKFFCLE